MTFLRFISQIRLLSMQMKEIIFFKAIVYSKIESLIFSHDFPICFQKKKYANEKKIRFMSCSMMLLYPKLFGHVIERWIKRNYLVPLIGELLDVLDMSVCTDKYMYGYIICT